DQSILNALFAEDCYRLDARYNVKVYATTDPKRVPAAGVFHFVGSPKPWDIGGRLLLPHARRWYEALAKTAIPAYRRIFWLNPAAWSRMAKIRGGYARLAR